jgi:hypothetical protein
MRRGLAIGVWCLLLAPSVFTQKLDDFSGKWIVDQQKTAQMRHMQPGPRQPPGLYYEVTQTAETITIETKTLPSPGSAQIEGPPSLPQRSVYRLDGSETKNQSAVDTDPKHAQTCRAEFNDHKLVATCTANAPGVPKLEVRTFRREDSWLVVTTRQTMDRKKNPEVELTAYWKLNRPGFARGQVM